MLKDPELNRYYEAQFDLFAEPGWEDFIEDVKKVKESLPTIEQINTEAQLNFVKGQLDILKWILQRKDLVARAYDELERE